LQTNNFQWRHLAVAFISAFPSPSTDSNTTTGHPRPLPDSEKIDDDKDVDKGYENSEAFKAFVRKKLGFNSTVAEYLESVQRYLLNFRSPVIRQDPHFFTGFEAERGMARNESRTHEPKDFANAESFPRQPFNSPTGKTKVVVALHTPHFGEAVFGHCPVNDCKWTRDRGVSIMFSTK
jgi:hypothetical protein